MIRNIKIQCPRCHGTCEIYLSTNAPVVILNCPSCWTPMLHNDDGVYILSQRQITDIVNGKGFRIDDLLEKVSQIKETGSKAISAHHENTFDSIISSRSSPVQSPASSSRISITNDDIIDLKIDLATCRDSLDFISRL